MEDTMQTDTITRPPLMAPMARAHRDADRLAAGHYYEGDEAKWTGCSIGCFAREIGYEDGEGHHAAVAEHYGYPEWLARLQDTIFEGLPASERAEWHVQIAEAVDRVNAMDDYDWQRALHRVHVAILGEAERHAGASAPAVAAVRALHVRAAEVGDVTCEAWSAAWSAAEAAARSAAEAAARSAAWSAGAAAWSAAEAAWSAARSAAWSAAESAARSAAFRQLRDGILAALAL